MCTSWHTDRYVGSQGRVNVPVPLTLVNSTYPGFTSRLFNLFPMSQIEMQTCLLIKMRASTTEIANTLNKSTSAISSMRSRLYGKAFHDKKGAKEWDEFILSL